MRSNIKIHDVVYRGYLSGLKPVTYSDKRVVHNPHYTGLTSKIGGIEYDQWGGHVEYYNSLIPVYTWVPTGMSPDKYTEWENDSG